MRESTSDNLIKYLNTQRKKFLNTVYINLVLLTGLFIFLTLNIYSSVKDVNNSAPDRILIYVTLGFLILWSNWFFLKNLIGSIVIKKLEKLLSSDKVTALDLSRFPLFWIFSGTYYHLIEEELDKLIDKFDLHQKKEKANLIFLNFKLGFVSFFILLWGISYYVSMVIYFKNSDFSSHWELIFGLVMMIAAFLIVFIFTIPRQIIINKKLNDLEKQNLDDYDYYENKRFFAMRTTLEKLHKTKEVVKETKAVVKDGKDLINDNKKLVEDLTKQGANKVEITKALLDKYKPFVKNLLEDFITQRKAEIAIAVIQKKNEIETKKDLAINTIKNNVQDAKLKKELIKTTKNDAKLALKEVKENKEEYLKLIKENLPIFEKLLEDFLKNHEDELYDFVVEQIIATEKVDEERFLKIANKAKPYVQDAIKQFVSENKEEILTTLINGKNKAKNTKQNVKTKITDKKDSKKK
ncbi:hypothetical protein [Mesoplasma lactucae]|uniref:Uncharacterized protein n=1 Tax=Mesoplasma lactucae ATCC 49193 TaxID=81460 RepID=A0A291IR53_9MOLU|nr:hypothetical protein [Mesoplasma lactucae]ATG97253.1 hypothetical protein CP520_00560 [Mesoplasma lactucae ATCC 49193]ATZ20300.1 hypothetical protein MLACT_v1c04790 [Mesoplasma lactucae ATCC 49193]MCL8216471.1 hypothetical protein [Mesoplasma lactucae ATCC 49193]